MATQIPQNSLDIEDQIVRIRRMIDDGDKLHAENAKLTRDTRAVTWQLIIAFTGAVATILAAGGGLVGVGFALAHYFGR